MDLQQTTWLPLDAIATACEMLHEPVASQARSMDLVRYCSLIYCDAMKRRWWWIMEQWHMSGSESVVRSVPNRQSLMGLSL